MARQLPNRPTVVDEEDSAVVVHPGSPDEQRKAAEEIQVPADAAVLTVRNMVLFPGTIVPIAVAREKSRRLLDDILPEQKVLVIVCQKEPDIDDPRLTDLYDVGTAAAVLKLLRMDDGSQSIIVSGMKRV